MHERLGREGAHAMTERDPPTALWVSVCIHCGRPDYAYATPPEPDDGDQSGTPTEERPQPCPYCTTQSGKLYRYVRAGSDLDIADTVARCEATSHRQDRIDAMVRGVEASHALLTMRAEEAIARAERAEKIIEDLCGVEVEGTIISVLSRDRKGNAFPHALVIGLQRDELPSLYVVMEATERAPKDLSVGMGIRAKGRDGRYTWGTSDGGVMRRVFEATSIEVRP